MQQPTTRQSASAVTIDTNVRCARVYPTADSNRVTSDLQTVGIKLTKEQAIHLARVLLAVTQEWDEVDITAFRLRQRQDDGTFPITITSQVAVGAGEESAGE
jgi:hypothetical protein